MTAKTKQNPFRQKTPRRITIVRCRCFAKPVLFLDWDDMTPEARDEFGTNGPIPCEGGGVPGDWCRDCRFGSVAELKDEE